jgi:uncharacterized protein with PIN domain
VILIKRDAILEKRNAILEKRDEILEKRDAILEKRDAILEKRDAILEKRDAIFELELKRRLRPSWALFVARCAACDMVLACARGGTKSLVIAVWGIERGEGLPGIIQPVFECAD